MIQQEFYVDSLGREMCKTISTSGKDLLQAETGVIYGAEVVDIAGRYTYEEVGADEVTPEEVFTDLEAIL